MVAPTIRLQFFIGAAKTVRASIDAYFQKQKVDFIINDRANLFYYPLRNRIMQAIMPCVPLLPKDNFLFENIKTQCLCGFSQCSQLVSYLRLLTIISLQDNLSLLQTAAKYTVTASKGIVIEYCYILYCENIILSPIISNKIFAENIVKAHCLSHFHQSSQIRMCLWDAWYGKPLIRLSWQYYIGSGVRSSYNKNINIQPATMLIAMPASTSWI